MKFNSTFPSIPLVLIRETGFYLLQHTETEKIEIKSPVPVPCDHDWQFLIGEETGTYRSGTKYIRKVKITLFPIDPDVPWFNLEMGTNMGITKFDRVQTAYTIPLEKNTMWIKIN